MEMEMENKLIFQKRNLLLLVKASPLSISTPISDPRTTCCKSRWQQKLEGSLLYSKIGQNKA